MDGSHAQIKCKCNQVDANRELNPNPVLVFREGARFQEKAGNVAIQ